MSDVDSPRWWSLRPAQNRKPATYRCPLCGNHLPALSEHVLITPEGDGSKRRHAHRDCVIEAREAGRLRTRDEWRREQRAGEPGLLERVKSIVRGRRGPPS